MTIEASGGAGAATPVPRTGAAGARPRSGAEAPDPAGGGATFLSLFSALERAAAEPDVVVAKAAPRTATPSGPGAGGDALPAPPPVAIDTAVPDPGETDPAQHFAADAPAAGVAALLPGDLQPVPQRISTWAPDADAGTAMAIGAGRSATGRSVTDLAFDPAAGVLPMPDPASDATAQLPGSAVAHRPGAAGPGAGPAVSPFAAAEAQASREAGMHAERFEPSAAGADAGAQRAGQIFSPVASLFEAGASGVRAGAGARVTERPTMRQSAPAAGTGFVAWNDAMSSGTGHGASPVYAPGAATPVPATAVAQKMHYWVSRGVQSAELQLDAFGGGAVGVRISVKGDEAFVEFRSDHVQARRLLQDAMPQLKELLAGEGLVLSGGFVGGSAQQRHSGAHDRSGQGPAARSARVPLPAAASGALTRPVHSVPGASVDLFV